MHQQLTFRKKASIILIAFDNAITQETQQIMSELFTARYKLNMFVNLYQNSI